MRSENTSKASKEKENSEFPSWAHEIFYKFNLVYSEAWSRLFPTSVDKQALMQIYFDALSKYAPEIISQATTEHIAKFKYPELHQLVGLCEAIIVEKNTPKPQFLLKQEFKRPKKYSLEAQKAQEWIKNYSKLYGK